MQLTVHQKSLNFSERDTANFVTMSTVVPIVIPFVSGVVADKIGNFSDKKKSGEEKCSSFLSKFCEDFKNKETWKLKAVYFFLLGGIVVLWVQLTVHQKSLNFSERDTANFVTMSTVVPIVIPFVSGVVADKIGNFSQFVAILIVLLGVNTFCFAQVKPIKFLNADCEVNQLKSLQKAIQLASSSTPLANLTKCSYNHIYKLRDNLSDRVNHDENCADVINTIYDNLSNQSISGNCNETNQARDPSSYKNTYWTYFAIYACFTVLLGASYSLFDGTVMALQKEISIDYGLQRAWGTLAAVLSSYIGGQLIDVYSVGLNTKDYTLMFYCAGVCFIIAGLITFSINISFKLPATKFSKVLWKDLKNFEFIILIFIIVFKGALMAYAETFMYLFMSKLGASSSLMGLTITVGSSLEIVLQLLATPLIKLLGNVAVISIGLLCYSIRFVGFSYTYNPIVMVYLEAFDCWASGLTLTALVMYCTVLSSPATIASMRGLISVLHDGIGRVLGAQIGIEIIDSFGDRVAWRIMSLFALLVAVVYFVTLEFYERFRKKKFRGQAMVNNEEHIINENPDEIQSRERENCHINLALEI